VLHLREQVPCPWLLGRRIESRMPGLAGTIELVRLRGSVFLRNEANDEFEIPDSNITGIGY